MGYFSLVSNGGWGLGKFRVGQRITAGGFWPNLVHFGKVQELCGNS
jgi:hypothetical protein